MRGRTLLTMSTTTPAPPRLFNTAAPDPEHHGELRTILEELIQHTGASYGMVFGTHGLHLLRAGDLGQVGAESITSVATHLLLLSRGAGKLGDRDEVETIVVRYSQGALVLAPLGASFGLGLFTDNVGHLPQIAHAISHFTAQAAPLLPPEDLTSQADLLARREEAQ